MSILSDHEIIELCVDKYADKSTIDGKPIFVPMIQPFVPEQVRKNEETGQGVISFGISSYGYDVRIADEFKIFTNVHSQIIDPKRFDQERCLVNGKVHTDEVTDERFVILPPNSYLLGRTVESFVVPRYITGVCLGKSTYARVGCIVNVTPIEAGFVGTVVIEIANTTTLPMKIYVDEGIAQFLWFRGNRPCLTSYADRNGKYQNQTGVTLAKI